MLLGAYLFGGVTMLQFHLQGQGVQVASQLLTMLPYLATIVVLVLISRNPTWIRLNMPGLCGKPFYPAGLIIIRLIIAYNCHSSVSTRFHTWR